ncbi:MAG: endonuclease/exonuclease/phosphatase family protein [Methanospirillum sp.]|nr:endonuclease/exonuclease/phosphatase family protein [Methanospirillum sp.]
MLHVRARDLELDILGLRIPDYSRTPARRRECWDWIESVARAMLLHPSVILGDFNTDPTYSPARCGDRFRRMEAEGWHHAKPPGSSYWTPGGGRGRQLDHAFFSPHFRIAGAGYVRASNGFAFAGKGPDALSDHAALLVEVERLPTGR